MTIGISLLAGADFIYLIMAYGDCESSVYLSRNFLFAVVNTCDPLNIFVIKGKMLKHNIQGIKLMVHMDL